MRRIAVAQPELSGNEKKYVLDCLDSSWISSKGKYLDTFEKSFAQFCNVKHAISANNGTTALHLALVALNLQPGDEVIVPTVTYIATANAVRYCSGIPILVDVCENTLNIDPNEIEKKITKKTKGIIAVHLYGHPADMKNINLIAKKYDLWVVEDAAEAHGAEVDGNKVGSLGNCATFSFFGNKIVTTGEGGMITTNDDQLAEKLKLFRGQGMDPNRRYWFPVIGYNYRMTNIQAAIGLAQLERIGEALAKRSCLAKWYNDLLKPFSNQILLPKQLPWAKHVFWMYTIYLREGDELQRDKLRQYLDEMGIETRPVFYPLHILPPYAEVNQFPVANYWASRGINLPTHEGLTLSDINQIVQILIAGIKLI